MIEQWAFDWGVSLLALADLRNRLQAGAMPTQVPVTAVAHSEARVSQELRLEAAEKGILLFRNNVGALQDDAGRWVRYGLCNDSQAINESFKSSDFVGVGRDGRFVAREVKHEGWIYRGTGREPAQQRFIELINAHGGDAAFATGRGSL